MDPLSIAASIITLITAAGAVRKQLEDIRARTDPRAEFLAVMNLDTDLQITLITVRDSLDALRDSKYPSGRETYESLPGTVIQVQKSLDRLLDFVYANMLKNGKTIPRLGLNEKKRRQLSEIRQTIAENHRSLHAILLCANLRQTPGLLSAIQETAIVQRDHFVETSATLEQMMTQIADIEAKQKARPETSTSLTELTQVALFQERREMSSSSQLRITTAMPQKTCDWTCNCQCHIRSQIRTPRYLSAVIGTLFYSSTINLSPDVRPCNSTRCLRSRPSSSWRFTYYFPTWMMRSALIYSAWDNLDGRNSSCLVKVPIEIPMWKDCWHHIQAGSVAQIKRLLMIRAMTPHDFGTDGGSVLHWAVNFWQVEICEVLVVAGADWHFKDRFGRSPLDGVWRKILMYDPDDYWVKLLRALVGPEESYDLCLNPLHRILVGLSGAHLQTQLELDPKRVDDRDWLGTTPLMWAALRNNLQALRILLSHNANANLIDSEGRTALHHASRSGSLECVEALLDAKADPTVTDINILTPLHDVAYVAAPALIIKGLVEALQRHGADIEACDNKGWTPLMIATDMANSEAAEALLQCGADVNASNWDEAPIIARAIFRGDGEVVRCLCRWEAQSSWSTKWHKVDNILKEAAIFGTVETMRILADSKIPMIDCRVQQLRLWFGRYRDRMFLGEREAAEDELAAFEYLLEKKAIPIAEDEIDDPEHQAMQVTDIPNDEDSDGEGDVVFEDALEVHSPNFDELEGWQSVTVAVC